MNTKSGLFIELWQEARTRFSSQIEHILESDLKKRLPPCNNSLGFLIRHIGDVELLFSKNVFGEKEVRVTAKTIIAQKDTGEWTDLEELKNYVHNSYETLKKVIEKQNDEDWESIVETKEFGKKNKAEAFGRIISHTTYHAGQMAIINKYGSI